MKTSISLDSSIVHLPFGEHLCLFYLDGIDRTPSLIPIIKGTVQGRERLILLADDEDAPFTLNAWSQAGYDVNLLREQKRLITARPQSVLQNRGGFDAEAAVSWFRAQFEAAMLDGCEGVRVIHDAAWVVRSMIDRSEFIRFEASLNEMIRDIGITIFCHFDRRSLDSTTLLGLLKAHPKTVVGQRICDNDYFVEGGDAADPDQELNSYLDRLRYRQRVRDDLRSARDQFQSLVEHVPAGILMLQPPDGRPRFMNSFCQTLLGRGMQGGVTNETICERLQFYAPDGNLYPSDQLPVVRALRERRSFRVDDIAIRRPDGNVRLIAMLAAPIFDDIGELGSVVAILEDITDRRQVEEQLLASERRYSHLLTTAGEAICLVNLGTMRFVTVNEAFTRLLGYNFPELGEISPYALLTDELPEQVDQWVAEIMDRGRVAADATLNKRDGGEVIAEVRFTMLEEAPEPIAMAIINDITARKELEARLRDYARVESEGRRRLESILDTSPMGILLIDVDDNVVAANPATGRLFNVADVKQHIGKSAIQLIEQVQFSSANQTKLGDRIQNLARDHSLILADEVFELTDDGSNEKRVVSMFTSPVRGDDQQYLGRVWVFSDLTEERRLQHQLWQAQKMESIGTLAGGIAHDFNNILVGVMGHAGLARSLISGEDRPDGRLIECLSAIETAADRAATLNRELLAYARGGKARDVPIDVNRLIHDTLEITRPSLAPKIEIRLDLDEALKGVIGDPGQIHQVLLNLSMNAAEAMPRGGILSFRTDSVSISSKEAAGLEGHDRPPQGSYVLVEVTDTGPGITDEVRSRIFEPFYSTKGFGRGLGLAAVYGIVTNHTGYLRVESSADRGSCFRIYLPEAPQLVLSPTEDEPAPLPGDETILILDEDQGIRSIVRESLEQIGYRVLDADEPARARRLYEEHGDRIDVAVIDSSSISENGDELRIELKTMVESIPLLMTTSYSQSEEFTGPNGGKRDFLEKPYRISVLTRKIRGLLDA
jgi:PAS domain S-box-containing protein